MRELDGVFNFIAAKRHLRCLGRLAGSEERAGQCPFAGFQAWAFITGGGL